MLRIASLFIVLLFLAGCKLAVIVVEGGTVVTNQLGTGTRECSEGEVCIFEVTGTDFNETFTAVPNPGWKFVRWNSGEDMQCVNMTEPHCMTDNTPLAGNSIAEAVIASDRTFYLMPVFESVWLPITNTVMVDGREWAQPKLFTNLSWYDVNIVCPNGHCVGSLNGYDVTGWNWASVDDFNSLANDFIGAIELGPGPTTYLEINSSWAQVALSTGYFLPTYTRLEVYGEIAVCEGWLNQESSSNFGRRALFVDSFSIDGMDQASSQVGGASETKADGTGAWLYRTL